MKILATEARCSLQIESVAYGWRNAHDTHHVLIEGEHSVRRRSIDMSQFKMSPLIYNSCLTFLAVDRGDVRAIALPKSAGIWLRASLDYFRCTRRDMLSAA